MPNKDPPNDTATDTDTVPGQRPRFEWMAPPKIRFVVVRRKTPPSGADVAAIRMASAAALH
jgi:hypothetical protein